MNKSPTRQGIRFLSTFIDSLTWAGVLGTIAAWAAIKESRYICTCNVHAVVSSWADSSLLDAINNADLATPDGMPLVWLMRKKGYPEQQRINGPDLMWRLCRVAEQQEFPVFFYGSTPDTLEKLHVKLKRSFANLKIAGAYSPPFRPVTTEEDEMMVDMINRSGAAAVFIGLGCPKQELWMAEHRGRINSVMIGVGAAFDFHAGNVNRAPLWMQNAGLEWLHRLGSQPARLWKRYLVTNSIFLRHFLFQLVLPSVKNTGKERADE